MVEDMGVATGVDLEAMIARGGARPSASSAGRCRRRCSAPDRASPSERKAPRASRGICATLGSQEVGWQKTQGIPARGNPRRGDAARLRSLLDIAKVVGATRRFDDLVELTAEEARRALDAASLSISRWDRESGTLRDAGQRRPARPAREPVPHRRGLSRSAWPTALRAGRAPGGPRRHIGRRGRGGRAAARSSARTRSSPRRSWSRRGCGASCSRPGRRGSAGSAGPTSTSPNAVATQVAAGVVQADHFAPHRAARVPGPADRPGQPARRRPATRGGDGRARRRRRDRCPLVLADINRLKQVNDSFGHDAGDRLIVAVADAVSRASGLAPGSLAARIGGDEFCIVVSGAPRCRRGRRRSCARGRQPADEHRVSPAGSRRPTCCRDGSTRRRGCSGWPTPRSTAPSAPASRTPVVAGQASPERSTARRSTGGPAAAGWPSTASAVLESGLEMLDVLASSGPAGAGRGGRRPLAAPGRRRRLVGFLRRARQRPAGRREQLGAAVRRGPRRARRRPGSARRDLPPRRLPGQRRRRPPRAGPFRVELGGAATTRPRRPCWSAPATAACSPPA